jgi:hypothetical protein
MTVVSILNELSNRAFVETALVFVSGTLTLATSQGWRGPKPKWPKEVEVTVKLRW